MSHPADLERHRQARAEIRARTAARELAKAITGGVEWIEGGHPELAHRALLAALAHAKSAYPEVFANDRP